MPPPPWLPQCSLRAQPGGASGMWVAHCRGVSGTAAAAETAVRLMKLPADTSVCDPGPVPRPFAGAGGGGARRCGGPPRSQLARRRLALASLLIMQTHWASVAARTSTRAAPRQSARQSRAAACRPIWSHALHGSGTISHSGKRRLGSSDGTPCQRAGGKPAAGPAQGRARSQAWPDGMWEAAQSQFSVRTARTDHSAPPPPPTAAAASRAAACMPPPAACSRPAAASTLQGERRR